MKKYFFLALCLAGVLIAIAAQAQTLPRYIYTNYSGIGNRSGPNFYSPGSHKFQSIYRPSELPGLPAGPIRSVYFRVGWVFISTVGGDTTTYNPTIYDSMRVKMGLTQDTAYKDTLMWGQLYYLFKTGLTQVFFQKSFTISFKDSAYAAGNPGDPGGAGLPGTWVRFPVDGFSYNPNANLVVELSRTAIGDNRTNYGFCWMASRNCYKCLLSGDLRPYSQIVYGDQADIGFNDATGAVGELVNLKGFYAYPNPSQGLFTVGFEPFGGQASTVQVSVSDMAGRQVWQRSYQGVRADLFTANVDLRDRPKGVYLLRVQAGEAQALQRVVVE